MSDAYIVRRGKIIQGGGGFDPNGAVLKVVTSTGCSVTVTGTGYSQTQQDGDGFPRSDDANVTEHFFSIPASAFGTIRTTVSKVYTNEGITDTLTTYKDVTINAAGSVYEVLVSAPNIILDSTFGLQNGWYFQAGATRGEYDSIRKAYKLTSAQSASKTYALYNSLSGAATSRISLIPFSKIEITLSTINVFGGAMKLLGSDNTVVKSYPISEAMNVPLSNEDKAFNPFMLWIELNQYGQSQSYGIVTTITRLVFS